ncbi:hypothetical protein GGR56DRAFT_612302 [Xylariaceae sp. FL0804]|nr:hypothetical protein GGR56DRAFT_612302 [Xylariaceae sp. FL0804]
MLPFQTKSAAATRPASPETSPEPAPPPPPTTTRPAALPADEVDDADAELVPLPPLPPPPTTAVLVTPTVVPPAPVVVCVEEEEEEEGEEELAFEEDEEAAAELELLARPLLDEAGKVVWMVRGAVKEPPDEPPAPVLAVGRGSTVVVVVPREEDEDVLLQESTSQSDCEALDSTAVTVEVIVSETATAVAALPARRSSSRPRGSMAIFWDSSIVDDLVVGRAVGRLIGWLTEVSCPL